MAPLRVLYVTHEPNLTGASRSLLDLLSSIDREKVDPTVLVRREGPLVKKLDELKIQHICMPYVLSIRSKYGYRPVVFKKIAEYFSVKRLARYFACSDFDIVHNNTLLVTCAMKAAKLNRIPYICHVRELISKSHGMTFVDEEAARETILDANTVIFISNTTKRKFSDILTEGHYDVIMDGIETGRYLLNHAELFQRETVTAMIAGRLSKGKGQLDAIKAVETLVDQGLSIRLIVVGGVGDEDYARDCIQYVKDHGLANSIEFIEFQEELSTLYRECDIALCCSEHEALGRVIIEGMLSGCLVISSDCDSALELIDKERTGYIYKQGSPGSLASVMLGAIESKNQSNSIANTAQEWAKNEFDAGIYATKLLDLYKSIKLDT